jgi:hypothetical protein
MHSAVPSANHVAFLSRSLKQLEATVRDKIQDLKREEFLEVDNDGCLHFMHKFIAEVAAATLSHDDLIRAHLDSVNVLLDEYNADKSKTSFLGMIAHHCAGANMVEEARE